MSDLDWDSGQDLIYQSKESIPATGYKHNRSLYPQEKWPRAIRHLDRSPLTDLPHKPACPNFLSPSYPRLVEPKYSRTSL